MIPTCSGIRSPGGIGTNHLGDMFYTDNQGPWNGACSLKHLAPGDFEGHPEGNKWFKLTPALGPPPSVPPSLRRLSNHPNRVPNRACNRRQNARSILPHGLQREQNARVRQLPVGQVRDIKAQRFRHG